MSTQNDTTAEYGSILIVGGTSGLGLKLAEKYAELGQSVVVTGRQNPENQKLKFLPFDMTAELDRMPYEVDLLMRQLPDIGAMVYCAGYYQEGLINELSDDAMLQMVNVGLLVPALLVARLKRVSRKPLEVMFITSTSQFIPRAKEPVYTAVKSGLGMFGNSLGLDPELGKVVVIAPSGMRTSFWTEEKDVSGFLDPAWVAEQVVALSGTSFKYRFVKIMRGPSRVEVVETR